MKQRCLIAVTLILTLLSLTPPQRIAAAEDNQRLRKVQLAYVLNFTKFITWPSANNQSSPTAFTIGIYGSNPFQELLATLEEKTVRGRAIKTKIITNIKACADCQVLIIPQAANSVLPEILSTLRGKPVATISTIAGFARAGGTIELLRQDNHVLFAINLHSAQTSGLTIPSQVLALAEEVLVALP